LPSSNQNNESEFSRELAYAIDLANEAGTLAVKLRDGDLDVEMKPGDEPVTIADKKASDHIVSGLTRGFPKDIVISEENADDDRRRDASRVWFVDPIDGTKDFIRGEDGFCVMIGLNVDSRPAMGVVYAPTSGRTFFGAVNDGAWVLFPEGTRAAMGVSLVDDMKEARLVASKSHRSAALDKVKSTLGIQDEQNIGSIGLKLALIALGERDLYVNPTSRCSTWDTCGPEAILVAAGGRLSDIDGGLLRYDAEENALPRGLLASNGPLHQTAVDKVAPLFPSL